MIKTELKEAIKAINDHDTIAVGGSGAGHGVPDKILEALGLNYLNFGTPKCLTIVHPCGVGDNNNRGLNHLAHEGLVKRDIGGFFGNAPKLAQMALDNKIEAYNFPQGALTHLMRTIAGNEKGLLTKVGLNTFVDPDFEGGKVNKITSEDLVEKVKINKDEFLFYKSYPINVAIIRGSSADAEGNITMEEEVGTFSMLSLAQAAKVNGGIVIAQVKKHNKYNHVPPERVKVPGVMVDYVIEVPEQTMTFITDYNKALIDRNAEYHEEELELEGIKSVISRRAADEAKTGDYVNLGYGMPDGVPIAIKERGKKDEVTFMIEQGPIGGVLTTGLNFGAMFNPSAIVDDGYQFDFFHGGGLDVCFLGFAQIDQYGNVNSSRFGSNLTGCGGAIDISQNAKKVVFCGAFAAKSEISITHCGLDVKHPGKFIKFVKEVQQVTFNGQYAFKQGKEVLYVTERAVFRMTEAGLELIEVAPGINVNKDILDMMEFKPIIKRDLAIMSETIFNKNAMGIA